MAKSANRPEQKQKAAQFSEEQKKKIRTAQAGEKTHLIPDVEWQSTDNLILRGDVAEAIQDNLMAAYQSLQRAGQAFQVMLNMSIKENKAKLTYAWNNGEPATEEDVNAFKQQMEMLNHTQKQNLDKVSEAINKEIGKKHEPETNLVTPGGAPLTAENLDAEKKIL